jgi:hypothetical protein
VISRIRRRLVATSRRAVSGVSRMGEVSPVRWATGPYLAVLLTVDVGPQGSGVEMRFSLRCLLLGHDDWVVRSPERLRLRCDHCWRETPGWELTRLKASRPPQPVVELSGLRGSRLELSEHP